MQILNSTFNSNIAKAHGGAITQGFNPYLQIKDTEFYGNLCLKGQAGALNIINYMFPQFSYAVLLENLVFEGNIAK